MEYACLGRTGLRVSRLCLGTMTFGDADDKSMMHKVGCNEETAHAIMSRALDSGVNFFDTADVYGQDGLTERIVGNWFKESGRRDQVVLATKFRFGMGEGPNRSGASRLRIVRCVEESLRRLQTDRIDLYQVHMQDNDTPEDETLRALDDLVRAGKVLYTGCSNYTAYRLLESLWQSEKLGLTQYCSLQPQYNLLSRAVERELIPACERHGVGVIPWAPLAGGVLTGKYDRDTREPEDSRLTEKPKWWGPYDRAQTWDIVDTLKSLATELQASVAQVALAWLLHKPSVTSVIVGARSLNQLEDNLPAASLRLPASAMDSLDRVSAQEPGYPYNMIARVHGRW